jgi:NCS1 family nucleobase:cation symporter-1
MGIPGLIGQYQPKLISDAARYMYMMGWLLTFFTSSILYFIATFVIKPRIFPRGFETSPFQWEWLANEGREGFFDGERDGGDQYSPSTSPVLEGEEVHMSDKTEKGEKSNSVKI